MQALPRAILVLSLLALPAAAAEHTVEARPDNTFSPKNLEIEAGDTVTWVNMGGLHNVVDESGSFRCAQGCDGAGGDGDPSSSSWSFSLTFDDPGEVKYFCEVHASLGMSGTVTVNPKTTSQPGTLGFSMKSDTVAENAGSVTVTVNRSGGTDGAVSVDYATSDGSADAGNDYTAASGTLNWDDGDGASKTFDVQILDDNEDESDETFNLMLMNPGGGASLGTSAGTITIGDDDDPSTPQPGRIRFATSLFEAIEGDGMVTINVTRSNGSDGAVGVTYATGDGSAEAGSDYSATSGMLSWADGDSSPKFFMIPLTDDMEAENDETINVMLSAPTGGATLASPSSATVNVKDNDTPTGAVCVPDAETLCLGQDGRFGLTVTWRDQNGNTGTGKSVDIGKRDSGLFFFFGENNIEMLAKVLNGCRSTNHYWVFFAATTNVEFTLTVVDTQAGVSKQYKNKLGNSADAVTDTSAFDTCP